MKKKSLLTVVGLALLGIGLLGSGDANAYACVRRSVESGESVRLRFDQSAFWLQRMVLTVRDFNEFAEPFPGPSSDSFCGIAGVQILPTLLMALWGGTPNNLYLPIFGEGLPVFSEAFLKPGTRLQLSETSMEHVRNCTVAFPGDDCYQNAVLYRAATVLNR